MGLTRQLAGCFVDRRNAQRSDHSVQTLVAQRVLALALGYEDLNDHNSLRHDPLLSAAADKPNGEALASAPTLNRLEISSHRQGRYHKVHARPEAVQALLRNGSLSLGGLVTHREPATGAAAAYARAFQDPSCLKMVLDWRAQT